MLHQRPKVLRVFATISATSLSLTGWVALSNSIPSAHASTWYNCLTREVWSPAKQEWCNKLDTLQNLTYTLPGYGTVSLQQGEYENSELRFTVYLANQANGLDFGDLNGDQVEDAVVLLGVNSGGSGQFTYLVPVLNVATEPQPLTPTLLGDRIIMNTLAIDEGIVVANLVTQGPNDPLCCPTEEVTWHFALATSLLQVDAEGPAVLPVPLPLMNSEPSAMNPSVANAVVSGRVTYRPRIALPPNATVEVSLQDVSRADAPAITIASQTIETAGRQVPFSFALPYDPAQIDHGHTYAVRASIYVDGQLRFTTTRQYGVITQGNPTTIDVVVDPVR